MKTSNLTLKTAALGSIVALQGIDLVTLRFISERRENNYKTDNTDVIHDYTIAGLELEILNPDDVDELLRQRGTRTSIYQLMVEIAEKQKPMLDELQQEIENEFVTVRCLNFIGVVTCDEAIAYTKAVASVVAEQNKAMFQSLPSSEKFMDTIMNIGKKPVAEQKA